MHWNLHNGFNISRALCRALHAEQMDTYEELGKLSKDDLEELFESMRHPGGPAGIAAVEQRSTNPGIRVTFKARKVIVLTVYAVRHFTRIQRPVDPTLITPAYLDQMHDLKLKEERLAAKETPTMPPVMKDETKIRQTVMDIRLHLQKRTGGYGIPLTYVIRQNEAVDNSMEYDGVGSVQEMIDRAPLTGHIYDTDNAAVWGVIATVIPPSVQFYVWIRAYETSENGRAAYMQIMTRHMGGRAAKNIVTSAKNLLRTKFFDNTKPQHHPFERFVNLHKKAHMDIDLYDERPILESEKIDYLITGVTAQELNHTCSTISLNVNNAFSTFDLAVSALQSELHRQEGVKAHRRRLISAIKENGKESQGRDGKEPQDGKKQSKWKAKEGDGQRGQEQDQPKEQGYIPQEVWDKIMERKRKREKETQDEIEKARAEARQRSAGAAKSSTQQDQEDPNDKEEEYKGRSISSMTRRR